MTVKTMIAKKPKGKRREVAPLEPIDRGIVTAGGFTGRVGRQTT